MKLRKEPFAYQWALPEALDIPPDEPRARLDFYNDSIILQLVENNVISNRMVSAQDVALAFLNEVPLTSGILPENALWWSQGRDGPEVALWQPPQVWPVAMETKPFQPPERLRIPLPGLIFICQPGRPPRIYAAKARPKSPQDAIFHAPLFNVFHNGRTCPGTHKYPEDIAEIPNSFFASFFTPTADHRQRSKKYPEDLLKLWRELDGKKKYPRSDLVPLGKVMDIMQ
jgi:PRTRC genetic system protein B